MAMVLAALFGSWTGMAAFGAVSFWQDPPKPSELWSVPLVVVVYGTIFGFPLALLGLAAVGLPLALMLRNWAERAWMPVIAVTVGALGGRFLYYAVDHTVFFGVDDFTHWIDNYGFLIGTTTSYFWLVFARRVIKKKALEPEISRSTT
jgi:hypothetical protein